MGEIIGTCRSCGRAMEARRRWRGREDEIRYCSNRCRRQRPGRVDRALEDAIMALLAARRHEVTICPSEAARQVSPDDWRPLLERCRAAARRLVAAGKLEIVQGGRVVDPSTARGPIRLRLARFGA